MRLFSIILAAVMIIFISGIFCYNKMFPRINVSFATKAYLRYHIGNSTIDTRLTDRNLEVLKKMLMRRSYPDDPACGFDTDYSITLTDGKKKLILCPALDGCATFRIGESDMYIDISDKEREWVGDLLSRY